MPPAPVVVPVDCVSDGTDTAWPLVPGSEYVSVDPDPYLTKLAQRYMTDSGQTQNGGYNLLQM